MKNKCYNFRPTAHYVSAQCGAGKTYSAARYIAENISKSNFIYVAPTLKLLEQTKQELSPLGVNATMITHKTSDRSVKSDVMRLIKEANDCGTIPLITWNAYADLPYFKNDEDWDVIIDEVPQVDRFYPWLLPRQSDVLRGLVDFEFESVNEHMHMIIVKNVKSIRNRLTRKLDDVEEVFREFLVDLCSRNTDMFVDNVTLDRWAGVKKASDGDKGALYFISMLNQSAFNDATLLGANIQDSLLYSWLSNYHKSRFIEHDNIKNRLRQADPTIGQRLKISYFMANGHNSKTKQCKLSANGLSMIDEMDKVAVEIFGAEKYLYVPNKGRKSSLDTASNVEKIPAIAHGLNDYSSYSNIYFSAALNREPKHFAMLNQLGITSEQVHKAHDQEVIYQSVMRTALRDPNSTKQVHAIVPDKAAADRLGALTGSSDISRIGSIEFTRSMGYTQTQKNQRLNARRALEELFFDPKSVPSTYSVKDNGTDLGTGAILGDQNKNPGEDKDQNKISASRKLSSPLRVSAKSFFDGNDQETETDMERNSPTVCVTFHKTVYDVKPDQHIIKKWSVSEFVSFMKIQSKRVVDAKDEVPLFNSAIFDPPQGAEGYRKKDYFARSSFMILDFDNGMLSPEEFDDIFWYKAGRAQKRSFIICNSFSRSPERPNKFRVVMFYRKPAQKLEEHVAVFDSVVARLMSHGFNEATSGLDKQCRTGMQSFYLPCTSRKYPECAFFRAHGTRSRDLQLCTIDPVTLERTQVKASKPKRPNASRFEIFDPAAVAEATAALRNMKEGRHGEVFKAGNRLASCGLSAEAIRRELSSAVGRDRHMQRKVEAVIKSLEKYDRMSTIR